MANLSQTLHLLEIQAGGPGSGRHKSDPHVVIQYGKGKNSNIYNIQHRFGKEGADNRGLAKDKAAQRNGELMPKKKLSGVTKLYTQMT